MDNSNSNSKIFREQLAIKHPELGRAVWEPDPGGYNTVQVGDVGFFRSGYFYCLFNALLHRDASPYHPSGPEPPESEPHYPDYVEQLKPRTLNHIRKSTDYRKDFRSKNVTNMSRGDNIIYASGPDNNTEVSFSCSGRQGALLYLPFPAERQDTDAKGDFEKWILKHIYDCMRLAEERGLGIKPMENIVLVTGRHLARSWARAVFSENPGRGGAEVSFVAQASSSESPVVHFEERNVSGAQLDFWPNGPVPDPPENQCIFIRGYHVVRVLNFLPKKLRALAGPAPLPDPEPDSGTHLQLIDIPANTDYQDPLHTLSEYIAEQNPSCDLVLVHDDDLKCIKNAIPALEGLQPDTLMESLRDRAPKTRQFQCESFFRNENDSEAGVVIATVATLSLDAFAEMYDEVVISSSLSTPTTLTGYGNCTEGLESPPSVSPPIPSSSRPGVLTPIDRPSDDLRMKRNFRRTKTKGKRIKQSRLSQVMRFEIDVLPDDILLEIFHFYVDTMSRFDVGKTGTEAWQLLIHVCRRWRGLVFGSPHLLDLHLFCTPKTPARDKLDIWPPLPLIVEGNMASTFKSDTDNIITALERNDRVCRVSLSHLAGWQLEEVLASMQRPFPALTELLLPSNGDSLPIIPDWFLGGSVPRLQYLSLAGISLPGLPKLLLSAYHLAHLEISNNPHFGYISPGVIAVLLSALCSLSTLSLEFHSPESRPDWGRGSRHPPPPNRSVAPGLTSFHFKGVIDYLEELVACIYTPRLDEMHITFFNRIDFDFPQLAQFIDCTPALRECGEARVQFEDSTASVRLGSRKPASSGSGDLSINISCGEPDWQLSSIEQICNSSLPPLSTVEDLYIECRYSELVWVDDSIDNALWLRILLPFTTVKNLYLSEEFAPGIAVALQEQFGFRITEVLPGVRNIFVEGLETSKPFQEYIAQFVTKREHFSHPVVVSGWDNGAKIKSMDEDSDIEMKSELMDDDSDDAFYSEVKLNEDSDDAKTKSMDSKIKSMDEALYFKTNLKPMDEALYPEVKMNEALYSEIKSMDEALYSEVKMNEALCSEIKSMNEDVDSITKSESMDVNSDSRLKSKDENLDKTEWMNDNE